LTEPSSWFHVSSNENPSDLASRGMAVKQFCDNTMLLNGPTLLWQQMESSSQNDIYVDPAIVSQMKAEMRKVTVYSTSVTPKNYFDPEHVKGFSSWYKAKQAVANCFLLKNRLVSKIRFLLKEKALDHFC